jgi:hypothetical protein
VKNHSSHYKQHYLKLLATSILLSGGFVQNALAQAELEPWGNLAGIRIEGQLMEFESSLRTANPDWSKITSTGKELQRPKYKREGTKQIVTTSLGNLLFTEQVEDTGTGSAKVTAQFTSKADTALAGAFFSLRVPNEYYAASTIAFIDPKGKATPKGTLSQYDPSAQATASGIRLVSANRQLEITFTEPTPVIIKKEGPAGKQQAQLYLPIHLGNVSKGQTAQKTFTLKTSGTIDRKPVQLTLNTAQPGRAFVGFGGNFRLQNSRTDPQVIDYSLKNMRVAYGRVEMPWQLWQPNKDEDAMAAARQGKLHPHVKESMEIAQRLSQMGMPVIVTAWSAPNWAIVGPRASGPRPDGVWGNPLDKANLEASYKSITDYLLFLKEKYGVEAIMFSFNESDLGINVRQTGQEHADLIKNLGAYFASKGLKTKLLLGDNSDATTYEFIYPAMQDPATKPYIGAVSFHSWRGWDTPTLNKWAAAAKQLQLPLIVGEGSIDAQAWGYPGIFEEPTYALAEINLYTRLLAICQPQTILQWQLTADYSPLSGGGIFGDNGPLRPTQRFWNLKQLASTPKDVVFMPLSSDGANLSVAALGNAAQNVYAVHLVNQGATRKVTLAGLPAKVKTLRFYVTDKTRSMKEEKAVAVANGKAQFTLDASSYATLISQ